MRMAISENYFLRKYSWPLGIVMVLAAFMAMTLGFVKKAFSERVDLVAADYYYRDKAFSDRLAREKNLLRRGEVTLSLTGETIEIALPAYFTGKNISGTLLFYSPVNPAEDFSLPVQFSGRRQVLAARADIHKTWRVALDFKAGGEGYFAERLVAGR